MRCPSFIAAAPPPPHVDLPGFTQVELVHVEERLQQWIRFGRPAREQLLDRRRRILFFAPGAVFAFVRWRAGDHGTVLSRIDILQAPAAAQGYSTIPSVAPGGISLLRLSGWPKVSRALAAIDGVEALAVDPADACPDHWRHVHNQLACGRTPRDYSLARHRAWQLRSRLLS